MAREEEFSFVQLTEEQLRIAEQTCLRAYESGAFHDQMFDGDYRGFAQEMRRRYGNGRAGGDELAPGGDGNRANGGVSDAGRGVDRPSLEGRGWR